MNITICGPSVDSVAKPKSPSEIALEDVKASFYAEQKKFEEYKPLLKAGDPETIEKARRSSEHMKRMLGMARVLMKEIEKEQKRNR